MRLHKFDFLSFIGTLFKLIGGFFAILNSREILSIFEAIEADSYFFFLSLIGSLLPMMIFGFQNRVLHLQKNNEIYEVVSSFYLLIAPINFALFSLVLFIFEEKFVSLCILILAFININSFLHQKKMHITYALFLSSLVQPFTFFIFLKIQGANSIENLKFIYFLSLLFNLLLSFYKLDISSTIKARLINFNGLKNNLLICKDFFITAMSLELIIQLPILYLVYAKDGSLSLYFIFYKFFLIFGMFYSTINRVYMPNMSSKNLNNFDLQKNLFRTSKIMTLFTVLGTALILILHKSLLDFFFISQDKFHETIIIIILLGIFHLINGITGISNNILLMRNSHILFRNVCLVGLILTIISLVLLFKLGIYTTISSLTTYVFVYSFVKITGMYFCLKQINS